MFRCLIHRCHGLPFRQMTSLVRTWPARGTLAIAHGIFFKHFNKIFQLLISNVRHDGLDLDNTVVNNYILVECKYWWVTVFCNERPKHVGATKREEKIYVICAFCCFSFSNYTTMHGAERIKSMYTCIIYTVSSSVVLARSGRWLSVG